MRAVSCLVLMLVMSGCSAGDDMNQYFNRLNFSLTGGSFFSDASEVSVKQVLLDNGTLLGREVILEGELVDAGDFATHMIVKDNSGQLLVLLTDVDKIIRNIKEVEASEVVRVLGTVERGQMGLPYLGAISVIGMNSPSRRKK